MMHPKVTVLTCVYNGLPYLREAIDSTLNQTYEHFEYLIIDDASPDENVVKLIKSYNDNSIHIFEINPRFSTTTCILPSLGIDPFNYNLSKIEQLDLLKYQGLKLNRTLINDMSKT